MPETEEEKQARWKAAAAKAFYTPQMMHALNMSKQQSQVSIFVGRKCWNKWLCTILMFIHMPHLPIFKILEINQLIYVQPSA